MGALRVKEVHLTFEDGWEVRIPAEEIQRLIVKVKPDSTIKLPGGFSSWLGGILGWSVEINQ